MFANLGDIETDILEVTEKRRELCKLQRRENEPFIEIDALLKLINPPYIEEKPFYYYYNPPYNFIIIKWFLLYIRWID